MMGMELLSYLFWPNPGPTTYENPKVIGLLLLCSLFLVASLLCRIWRRKLQNPVLRKLTRSWPRTALWFGIIGLFLVVSRAEGVSYVSMRFLWVVWGIALVLYVFLQLKLMRLKYYEPVLTHQPDDPREKYLPRKKRK